MAKRSYLAMLEPAPNGGYGVSFPDLPGCVSFGEDLEHAISQAEEALALHLEGMAEDGIPFPTPGHMGDYVVNDGRPIGAVFAAITINEPEGAERVNVYLPKSLLAQIERFGQTSGIDNRSTFIRLASRQYLAREGVRADRIPRINTEIRWEVDDRQRLTDLMVYDHRTGKDDEDRFGRSDGACCADWMSGADVRQTPEGVFIGILRSGVANDLALLVSLNEFAKIEGCEWAETMADAVARGIDADKAAVEHVNEVQARHRQAQQ